jgi:hypothetical protein
MMLYKKFHNNKANSSRITWGDEIEFQVINLDH